VTICVRSDEFQAASCVMRDSVALFYRKQTRLPTLRANQSSALATCKASICCRHHAFPPIENGGRRRDTVTMSSHTNLSGDSVELRCEVTSVTESEAKP